MSAALGELLTTTAHSAGCRRTDAPIWRGSYDVADERAQVGRPFGDGSPRQGRVVISAIRDTFFAWADKVGRIVGEDGKSRKLQWDVGRTLVAALGFINYRSGEIIATYEMIAKAANCCRLTAIRHMAFLRSQNWIDWARRSDADGQAANSYFFEIARLPLYVQIHLRQILQRRGVSLESHPERKGSGPVPNRAQRLAERLAKGFASARDRLNGTRRRAELMCEADFIRAETELFGALPTSQWAALRHPGDVAAQEAYSARLGIPFFDPVSNRGAPDSGVPNKGKRN